MDDHSQMSRIAGAAAGDADALQLLIIEHHGALHAKVLAGLGSATNRHVDAEDILQEAYAKAFRSVGECDFRSPRAFRLWLEGIVTNALRDQQRFLRRKKRDICRDVQGPARTSLSCEQLCEQMIASDSTPTHFD